MSNNTARPSNEAQTGATRKPYIVADNHTLRAQGRDHGAGEVVHLLDRDAKRLLESGAIRVAEGKATESKPQDGAPKQQTAQEVIASIEGMSAEQLAAAKAAEEGREGGARKTVLDAIEKAQAKLADADGQG